jgi:hypothetical protein
LLSAIGSDDPCNRSDEQYTWGLLVNAVLNTFSTIPDSRFDPAIIAFCLEGLLLAQRTFVEPGLFQRVEQSLTSYMLEVARVRVRTKGFYWL